MEKIKLNYVIVCDQAIIDDSGKISLIGVFDKVLATSTPALHGKFSVAITTTGGLKKSYPYKIEIINLDNDQSIASSEGSLEFKNEGANNLLANFVNVIFPSFGKYWIKLSVDGELITDEKKHYVLVEKQ